MRRRLVICELRPTSIIQSPPKPQQPQQHTNTPIQDYPTQPYYRSHVHVDTMNSVAQGQYQPAASTSVFHSQTNHALFAPSGSGNPTTHHTSTTGASQHQPSMSTTRQEQAQSQKAARANQRHTDNTHVSTQEDALGTGIIRAKNTYAAHATVPAPVEYSVDHQIILRDIRDEVYGLLKVLPLLCCTSRNNCFYDDFRSRISDPPLETL